MTVVIRNVPWVTPCPLWVSGGLILLGRWRWITGQKTCCKIINSSFCRKKQSSCSQILPSTPFLHTSEQHLLNKLCSLGSDMCLLESFVNSNETITTGITKVEFCLVFMSFDCIKEFSCARLPEHSTIYYISKAIISIFFCMLTIF